MSEDPKFYSYSRASASEVAASLSVETGKYQQQSLVRTVHDFAARGGRVDKYVFEATSVSAPNGLTVQIPKMTFYNYSSDEIVILNKTYAAILAMAGRESKFALLVS